MTFLDAMRAAGLEPAKMLELEADGKIHRYQVAGDKSGSRNGYYVLHSRPVDAGGFGSWRTNEYHTWHAENAAPQTEQQRTELRRQVAAMQRARQAEQASVHAAASARAAALWARARPATNAHPYLHRKGVHAYGVRQLRDMLVIPALDANKQLCTLQFISGDGTKRFLTGGRISGCYFPMGKPTDMLLLAEGYATAATLHQATAAAVAVCFSCGNMLAVAKALRAKFPDLRLVVCADNDRATDGNPGVTHARAAALAVGGYLAVPEIEDRIAA